jgi:hypothetical protein
MKFKYHLIFGMTIQILNGMDISPVQIIFLFNLTKSKFLS